MIKVAIHLDLVLGDYSEPTTLVILDYRAIHYYKSNNSHNYLHFL